VTSPQIPAAQHPTAQHLTAQHLTAQHPAATRPPLHDIAHLGYIELLTPKLCESLWFFVEVLGLTETCREGNSVYLRTWDDYEHHTVKLTAHETSGIRRVGLRASSQAALEARVAAIEAAGLGIGWQDGDPGIGPTYLFRDPDGHELELYWESEWYTPPEELRPSLKNQAQAYPGRGVCVRRLDHVNYLAREVPPSGDFVRDVLGGRITEQIMLDDGTISAQWLHFTNKGYDLVYTRDWTGSTGRLHHVAFAPDTRDDILRAADICLDHGVFIETGPHKHAIQQTFFLYVYEPGGNRIELANPVARLVLAPDWRTITWTEAERAKGQAWGLKTIESFHTHGTPPVGLAEGRGDQGEDGAVVVGDDGDPAVRAVPGRLDDAAAQLGDLGHRRVGVGHGEVRGPGGGHLRGDVRRVLTDAADYLAVEHERRVLEAVAAHVLIAVTEHGLVEGLAAVEVPAHLLVPGQRARFGGHAEPGGVLALPEPEDGAGRVHGHRQPAFLHDVHRLGQQLAARPLDLRGGRVGVVGGQVGRPDRRGVGGAHLGADGRDDPTVLMSDRVAADLRSAELDVPAEQGPVERNRLRHVVHTDIHPAGRTGRPPCIARYHLCYLPVV
jgi:catechol 2,3-dioxygenase